MLRFPRGLLVVLASGPFVAVACTSFGTDGGAQPDASTVPTSTEAGTASTEVPRDAASSDASTLDAAPSRDATHDSEPFGTLEDGGMRACTGAVVLGNDLDTTPFPSNAFSTVGSVDVGLAASFSGKAATARLLAGSGARNVLTATRPFSLEGACFEMWMQVSALQPTLQGVEVDFARLSVGGATVRIGFGTGGYFGVTGLAPFALPNADRPHHWVVRFTAAGARLTIDGQPAAAIADNVFGNGSVLFEVGTDASRTNAAGVGGVKVTVDDLHATRL